MVTNTRIPIDFVFDSARKSSVFVGIDPMRSPSIQMSPFTTPALTAGEGESTTKTTPKKTAKAV
jgi:hypothetical protein